MRVILLLVEFIFLLGIVGATSEGDMPIGVCLLYSLISFVFTYCLYRILGVVCKDE